MSTPKYGFIDGKPIDVGEGWELVPGYEIETSEMEFFQTGEWRPNEIWYKNYEQHAKRVDGYLTNPGDRAILAFRRRKKPDVSDGWNNVAPDCLPEGNRAFWYMHQHGDVGIITNGLSPLSFATHWRYCEGQYQIPLPPRELTLEEKDALFIKDWIESNRTLGGVGALQAIAYAALKYARQQKE